MNRLTIVVTDKMLSQIEEVRDKVGLIKNTDVVRFAIVQLVKKELENYNAIQKKKMDNRTTFVSKANKKIYTQHNICDKLGGIVVDGDTDENGILHQTCVYTIFEEVPGNKVSKQEQQVPITRLSPELVDCQYKSLLGLTGEDAKVRVLNLI